METLRLVHTMQFVSCDSLYYYDETKEMTYESVSSKVVVCDLQHRLEGPLFS